MVRQQKDAARVIAITSGKGGVGKTSTSVNLAIALGARGKRVALLDADLGLANVEVLLGLNSLHNLQHVIDGEMGMLDILARGPGGIEVAPGTSGLAKVADLAPSARQRVLEGLRDLQDEKDFVIIDTMAGIGQNAVAFNAAADEVILVTTPEPTAIVDAYAMLKTIYARRNDAIIRLVVNMCANLAQAKAVAGKLGGVSKHYLGRNLSFLGYIPRDAHVSQAVMQSRPFLLLYPNAPAAKCVEILAGRLAQQHHELEPNRQGFFRRFAQTLGIAS